MQCNASKYITNAVLPKIEWLYTDVGYRKNLIENGRN
jgi:hypothetical protein